MEKKKSIFSYYKPYKKIFFADMFFAMLSAAVALTIPLVVRYVTSTLIYEEKSERKNNKQLRTAEGSDARRSDRDCNRKA